MKQNEISTTDLSLIQTFSCSGCSCESKKKCCKKYKKKGIHCKKCPKN